MIKIDDYITSSGRYPERADSPELHKATILYATELLERVNKALKYLGLEDRFKDVSSGFRPTNSNKIANGSKKSAHLFGQAIDIVDDKSQTLCKAFTKEVLEMFDLYREDSDYTIGKNTNWTHLQTRPTRSGRRVFKP